MLLARPMVEKAEQLEGHPLPWRYETPPWLPRDRYPRLWRVLRYPNFLSIPLITLWGWRMVRRHGIEVIFTVPWYGEFFIAAYLLHRLTKLPLFVYIMDVWSEGESRIGRIGGFIASYFEPKIVNAAHHLWMIGPQMAEYYRTRYGVAGHPLSNVVDVEVYARERTRAVAVRPSLNDNVRVVHTGNIYRMNDDAVRNLMGVLQDERLAEAGLHNVRLELYTGQSVQALGESYDISPKSWLKLSYADLADIPSIQCQADILFLPMTFDASWKTMISTSFLTKLPEYLASGTPILVHAPSYATAAIYARQHDCALVVDTQDPDVLATAIQRLATDTALRTRLSANAISVAERYHDRRIVVAEFLGTFTE